MKPRRLSDGSMQAGTRRKHPRGAGGSRIRADVRLGTGGYSRRFSSWQEIADWIASPRFAAESAAINSIRLINLRREPDAGQ